MFWDKYPYDSNHELNLDWIIKNMKRLIGVYDQLPKDLQKFVDEWLEAHPEATTTVQDGSLTPPKLLANEPKDGKILSYIDGNFEWVDDVLGGKWKIIQVDCENRAASTIIINEAGEFVIIDFGDATAGPLILSAILTNGANVCKGVVISHFHHDHIGGYATVFASPLISLSDDCTAYLQRPYPDNWGISQTTLDAYDDFVTYFEGLGGTVVVPDIGEEYDVMGLRTNFYNIDYSYIDYANDPEFFNNMSLCCTFQFGAVKLGCWGDIYFEAEEHIIQNDSIGPCDIILAPHHGLSARINRSFIEALDPKLILMNLGSTSAEQDETFYNSAIRTYADETVKNIVDVNSGDVTICINGDGSFVCDKESQHYPQIIRNYPSMRNAVNVRNTIEVQDSQTGITDLLKLMEPNSEISMEIATNYKIATDLGLATESFIHIIKTTGGSTNNLWDRTTPGTFFFVIEVTGGVGNTQTRSIIGKYDGGAWRVGQGATQTYKANFAMATAGTYSSILLNTGFDLTVSGKIGVPVTGNYIIHIYNSTSTQQATLQIDGSDVGYSAYSHSSNFTVLSLTAGDHTINTVNQALRVMIEYVPNSNELDLSAFA